MKEKPLEEIITSTKKKKIRKEAWVRGFLKGFREGKRIED